MRGTLDLHDKMAPIQNARWVAFPNIGRAGAIPTIRGLAEIRITCDPHVL